MHSTQSAVISYAASQPLQEIHHSKMCKLKKVVPKGTAICIGCREGNTLAQTDLQARWQIWWWWLRRKSNVYDSNRWWIHYKTCCGSNKTDGVSLIGLAAGLTTLSIRCTLQTGLYCWSTIERPYWFIPACFFIPYIIRGREHLRTLLFLIHSQIFCC